MQCLNHRTTLYLCARDTPHNTELVHSVATMYQVLIQQACAWYTSLHRRLCSGVGQHTSRAPERLAYLGVFTGQHSQVCLWSTCRQVDVLKPACGSCCAAVHAACLVLGWYTPCVGPMARAVLTAVKPEALKNGFMSLWQLLLQPVDLNNIKLDKVTGYQL